MQLIDMVGFWTMSKKTTLIMKSIFWATFINTAIIILMTNANLHFAPYPLNKIGLQNQYPDLTETWYQNIGPQLAQTMFIMAVYPYIELTISGIMA